VVIIGPAGLYNKFNAWQASAYGSDWLIVQYAQNGSVITHWELEDAAVHSEDSSDGIYFTTDHGVVHLSGHYVYIQSPTKEMEGKLLDGRLKRPDRLIEPVFRVEKN
jgi:hypothetical protein